MVLILECMKLTDSQYARAYKKEIEAPFTAEEWDRYARNKRLGNTVEKN